MSEAHEAQNDPEKSAPSSPDSTSLRPYRSGLQEYERGDDTRPAYLLTFTEVKLLGIAGVSVLILSLFFILLKPLFPRRWVSSWMVGFLYVVVKTRT